MGKVREDLPTIEERLGSAIASTNLTQREGACPLDKLMALGMVSRQYPLADPVVALKFANDPSAYQHMLRTVRNLAAKIDRAKNMRMGPRLERIAKTVLQYWLNDLCVTCGGVGHQAIKGAPGRAARVCGHCHGQGKRHKPWAHILPKAPKSGNEQAMAAHKATMMRLQRLARMHEMLLAELDRAEQRVGREAAARLR